MHLTVDSIRTWNSLQHPHKPALRLSDSFYQRQAQSIDSGRWWHEVIASHTKQLNRTLECVHTQKDTRPSQGWPEGKKVSPKCNKCHFIVKKPSLPLHSREHGRVVSLWTLVIDELKGADWISASPGERIINNITAGRKYTPPCWS